MNEVDKRWSDFVDKAEKFLSDNNLGLEIEVNDKVVKGVEKILNMKPEDLYNLDNEEANKLGIMVIQYCFYIRKVYNRLKNTINYCAFNIQVIISKHWNDLEFEFIPKETRGHSIAHSNMILKRLMDVKLTSESRIQGLKEQLDLLRSLSYRLGSNDG